MFIFFGNKKIISTKKTQFVNKKWFSIKFLLFSLETNLRTGKGKGPFNYFTAKVLNYPDQTKKSDFFLKIIFVQWNVTPPLVDFGGRAGFYFLYRALLSPSLFCSRELYSLFCLCEGEFMLAGPRYKGLQ